MNPAHVLGVDIGGSGMKAAIVDPSAGTMVTDRHRIPTPKPATSDSMAQVFQDALGADVRVFSQADLVAESLADYLGRRPEMIGGGEAAFLTSGKPERVSSRATQFLRREISFTAA